MLSLRIFMNPLFTFEIMICEFELGRYDMHKKR
jgi:hypothetical protein